MLNLARRDVRDHVFKILGDLVSKNEIKFLKWDYNRNWSEPGWPEAGEDQQRIYVDYVDNLYWIIAELRRRHPGLEIETCSGGGGRRPWHPRADRPRRGRRTTPTPSTG